MRTFVFAAALMAASVACAQGQVSPLVATAPSAGDLLAQAMQQADKADYAGARASLDQALRLKPDLKPARYLRALIASQMRDADAAVADIDALGDFLSPEDRAGIKLEIYLDGGRYRQAIDAGKALVELQPKSADAWRRLAHARQYSEIDAEMPAALAEYAKALELDPSMLKVYALRGEILSARRDAKGVQANYEAWLAKAPNDAEAHAAYADALRRLGKTDEARVEIDRSLALKPTAQAYLARADLTPKDQHEAFLADIDRALALEPDSSFAYQSRAQRRAAWNEPELALADIEKALKLWPDNYGARQTRARLHQLAGRYDLAIRDWDALIAREPNQPVLLNDRCWARALANKELDLATADCEASLKIAKDPNTLDSLAFVKFRKGDLNGAIKGYDAALKAKPDLAASLYGRGVAKRRIGDVAGGDADLAAARKVAPDIDKRFAGYGVTP